MQQFETLGARAAMRDMQYIVNRELDSLHMDKRDRDDLIKSQQEQIKILRHEIAQKEANHATDVRHLTNLKMHAYELFDHSIVQMYLAYVVAFIAIGYVSWVW